MLEMKGRISCGNSAWASAVSHPASPHHVLSVSQSEPLAIHLPNYKNRHCLHLSKIQSITSDVFVVTPVRGERGNDFISCFKRGIPKSRYRHSPEDFRDLIFMCAHLLPSPLLGDLDVGRLEVAVGFLACLL